MNNCLKIENINLEIKIVFQYINIMQMHPVILNSSKCIKTIYHISDIHIRMNNARDNEYYEVFNSLFNKIKLNTTNSLIVCCGDIFHDGLSSSSIRMVKDFLCGLSELCDIIIFKGNHDKTINTDDYLSSVLHKSKMNDAIYLLPKSGIYIYGNITFGYTAVYDTTIINVPEIDDNIKIYLWHGTMYGCKINDTYTFLNTKKFKCKDFLNYDYVMLGDIHKFQYLNDEKTIAYCGSLIQQNHGETLENHGYIKWDLENKTSEHINIKNNYGFVTVNMKDDILLNYNESLFPKYTNLRIIHENCTSDFIQKIRNKISIITDIKNCDMEKINVQFDYKDSEPLHLIELNNNEKTVHRLMNYITFNKKFPDETRKLIKIILDQSVDNINYKYDSAKRDITLKSLIFNNFNIYGENNCIDYDALSGIINICGSNGIGKSTVAVNCLIYAIYGESELGTIGKSNYINKKSNTMETIINIIINGIEYKIERYSNFKCTTRISSNFVQNVKLYANGVCVLSTPNTDVITINKEIEKIIGKSDDLKKMCIMEQKSNRSFLDLEDCAKLKYMCEMLNFDVYMKVHDYLNSEKKSLSSDINNKNKCLYEDPKNKKKSFKEQLDKKLNLTDAEIQQNVEQEIKFNAEFNVVNKQKIENELRLAELSHVNVYDIEEHVKKKDDVLNTINELCVTHKILENELSINLALSATCEQEIETQSNINKKNEEFENNKKNEIQNINTEINDLSLNFTHCESLCDVEKELNVLKNNKEKLEQNNDNLLININQIQQNIDNLNKQIHDYKTIDNIDEQYIKYTTIMNELNDINEKEKIEKSKHNDIMLKYNKKKKYYEEIKNKYVYVMRHNVFILKNKNAELKTILNEKNINIQECEKMIDGVKLHDVYKIRIKYEKFISASNDFKLKNDDLKEANKKLIEYNLHLEMLKNHKYNDKCTICMSNDLTKDFLATKNNILNYTKICDTYKKNYDECETRYKKYVKYDEMIKKNTIAIEMVDKNKTMITNNNYLINVAKTDIDTNLLEIEKLQIEIANYVKNNEIENCKYEDCKPHKSIHDNNVILTELKQKILEYENLMNDVNEINNALNKYIEHKNIINEKYKECIKCGDLYEKYEMTINLEKTQQNKISILQKNHELASINIIVINMKIKECENIANIQQKNKIITSQINDKKIILCKLCNMTNDAYDKYVQLVKKNDGLKIIKLNIDIKINDVNNKLIFYKNELQKIQNEIFKINTYHNLIADLKHINEKHKLFEIQTENAKKETMTLYLKKTKFECDIKNIIELENEVVSISKIFDLHSIIVDIIDGEFFEDLFNKQIIPKLTSSLNSVLSLLVSYNVSMVYNKKHLTVYKNDLMGNIDDANLSGNESLVFNIAFRLCINNINKLYKTNFFIIDESFCYCDDVSVTKIPNLFAYMQKMYQFIIVVSHNEQIKSYADMDIQIIQKNDYSYVNVMHKENESALILLQNNINDEKKNNVVNKKNNKLATKRTKIIN